MPNLFKGKSVLDTDTVLIYLFSIGPSHKLAANGYYTRDGRREVHPPTVLADGTVALASGEAAVEAPRLG